MKQKEVRHIQEKFQSISVGFFKNAKMFLNEHEKSFNRIERKLHFNNIIFDVTVSLEFKSMKGSIAFVGN